MNRYVFKERGSRTADLAPYEQAERKHADGPDALRYIVMSRPSPAEMAKPRMKPGSYADWESKLVEKRKSLIRP
jgi:hypothetical protein